MIKSEGEPVISSCTYGSGWVAGYYAQDACSLGSEVILKDFQFGVIRTTDIHFDDLHAIVGMAYPAMAYKDFTPFFDSLMKAKTFDHNIFAFYYSMNRIDKSELTLGDYNSQRLASDITWHKAVGKMYWALELDDILINGKSMQICKASPNDPRSCRIMPDSGTSYMTMPNWAYARFTA